MQKENLKEKKVEKKLFNLDMDTQREIAKIGMTASMGITVATAFFMKDKMTRNLHTAAGTALVAFSLWHHFLYPKPKIIEKNQIKSNTKA